MPLGFRPLRKRATDTSCHTVSKGIFMRRCTTLVLTVAVVTAGLMGVSQPAGASSGTTVSACPSTTVTVTGATSPYVVTVAGGSNCARLSWNDPSGGGGLGVTVTDGTTTFIRGAAPASFTGSSITVTTTNPTARVTLVFRDSSNADPAIVEVTFGGSSSGGSSAGNSSAPAPIVQQFGMPATGTCDAAQPEGLDWSGVSSGGWGVSWAQWMHGGNGGAVCTRTLVYSAVQSKWIVG